jgi:leucyl aminopeptidase
MTLPALPFVTDAPQARPVLAVRPGGLAAALERLEPAQAAFLRQAGFTGAAQDLRLLPGGDGVAGAVLGLGEDRSPFAFGGLAYGLPEGDWALVAGEFDRDAAVLGFGLGAYRFTKLRAARRAPARLVAGVGSARAQAAVRAAWRVRDLINMPANLLGPEELAAAAAALAAEHGVQASLVRGAALERDYPTVAAVGRGSERAPVVASFRWQGSRAGADAPLGQAHRLQRPRGVPGVWRQRLPHRRRAHRRRRLPQLLSQRDER